MKAGTPYAVRFKVPEKRFFIDDMVRGRVVWDPQKAIGDFVIMRSNGMAVYNFCVAVDDYLMNISHVIRAEEHLSNTIKQILIFDAMGAKPPVYAHCSLILGQDRSKLSKRHGAASLGEFAAKGYIPAAMRTYLTMLGAGAGLTKEVNTDTELIQAFDPNRIVSHSAVFDDIRLSALNGKYLEQLPRDEYQQHCEVALRNCSFFPLLPLNSTEEVTAEVASLEKEFIEAATTLSHGSVKFIQDVVPHTRTILQYPFAASQQEKKGIATLNKELFFTVALALLRDYKEGEGKFPPASLAPEVFSDYINATAERLDLLPHKLVFFPSRLALTGSLSGPDIGGQLRLLEIADALLSKHSPSVLQNKSVEITPLKERMTALESFVKSREVVV